MNSFPWKNLIRPGILLLFVVIGCAATARFLSGAETLSDYAEKNPELAYGTVAEQAAEASSVADPAVNTEAETILPSDENPEFIENVPELVETTVEGDEPLTFETEETSAATETPTAGEESATVPETTSLTTGQTKNMSPALFTPDDEDVREERVTYAEGFFYEPLPATVFRRMSGVSYPEDCTVPRDSLRYLNVLYINFDDEEQVGELVCNEQIAEDLAEIFYDLYRERYPLESVRLIDDFGGDDDASMLANNTSCFNYRTVAGSSSLSNHAYGLAIDINPLYNPWVNHGKVSPPEAEPYADRSADFPHKITKEDFCCQCFVNHGFFWGGNWNNPDYQHFQRN